MDRVRDLWVAVLSILLATAWADVFPGNNAFGQRLRWGSRGPESRVREPAASVRQQHPLYTFVAAQQRRFVRESVNDWNCFTWVDLQILQEQVALGHIAELIEEDPEFKVVCDAMKRLSPAEREGVYSAALQIFPPTWAQQRFIGPPGQTNAGQQADKLIGQLVVQRVRQRVGQSPQQESPTSAPAKVGDKFWTIAHPTPVQVERTIVATVNAGEEVTAIAIDGPWVGVTVIQNGREIHGWIHRQNLTPSRRGPKTLEEP